MDTNGIRYFASIIWWRMTGGMSALDVHLGNHSFMSRGNSLMCRAPQRRRPTDKHGPKLVELRYGARR